MGLLDKIKGLRARADEVAAEHKDEIRKAVEKAEVAADKRTGGKYHDQIGRAGEKLESHLDQLEPRETQLGVESETQPDDASTSAAGTRGEPGEPAEQRRAGSGDARTPE